MSNDEFYEPPVVYESKVHAAATGYNHVERDLFDSVERYVNNPMKKSNFDTMQEKANESGQAFQEFVLAIASDNELDMEERANAISAIYCQAQDKRLDSFRKLAPDAEYEEGSTSSSEVTENVYDLFMSGMGPEDIALGVTNNYALGFMVDLEDLIDCAKPGKMAKSISFAIDAGEHMLDVGKMTAAVVIGTVIARKALKKLGD